MKKIKKQLKSFVIIMTLMPLFCMCSNAQNNEKFEDKVMELITLTGQEEQFDGLSTNMKSVLQNINREELGSSESARGDELADKYIAENLQDKLIKPLLVDMFKDKVTSEELSDVIEKLKTEEGKLYTTHLNEMSKGLDAATMGLADNIDGSNATKIEFTCPAEYGKKFVSFYENSQMKTVMDGLENMFKMAATMSDNDKDKQQAEFMIKYMRENLPVLMANSAFGKMTDADLDFGMELNNMPAYKKFIEAFDFQEVVTSSMQKSLDFVNDYKKWLKEQK